MERIRRMKLDALLEDGDLGNDSASQNNDGISSNRSSRSTCIIRIGGRIEDDIMRIDGDDTALLFN